MSRLTRCPACATVFRVTETQLASRQGFVRCGQCAKVFDARATLLAEAPAVREAKAPADLDSQAPADLGSQALADLDARAHAGLGAQAPADYQARPWAELDAGAPADIGRQAPASPDAPPPANAAATRSPASGAAAAPAEPAGAARAHADGPSSTGPAGPASEPLSDPEREYSLAEPEAATEAFEFGPRHRARSRLATALWGLGAALALTALAAQAAYWFRTELALAVPATRPHLEAACRALGCVIPPPRQIGLLSIESSELAVDRNVPGLLTLNATLRNRATFAQAHPSIEVTLTDAAERPLARRVLAPADYLGDRLAREPLFAAASEHAVQLHVDATAYGPTGYRLFLFHP
jgi:predicted Zn finger-like uncharacterized protein